MNLDIAPMALAFEFGSGIWSTRGPRQKYPIVPVHAKKLAFNWPEAADIGSREGVRDVVSPVSFNSDTFSFEGGRAILPKVMHPGIQPRPYIQPSIDAKINEIIELIGKGFIEVLGESIGPDVIVIQR